MHRVFTASLLAASLLAAGSVFAAPPPLTPPQDLQALQAAIAQLGDRLARLERAAPLDATGTYRLHGFQTELVPGTGTSQVRVYTYGGSITLNADGSYRSSIDTSGSELIFDLCCLPGGSARGTLADSEKGRGKWKLEGGLLTLNDKAGYQMRLSGTDTLFISTSSNTLDGTSVLLVMVRQP